MKGLQAVLMRPYHGCMDIKVAYQKNGFSAVSEINAYNYSIETSAPQKADYLSELLPDCDIF